ncbi:hypothetical protein KSF_096560 [Reticulibacter mediterranei]|uniref:Uncharacterized protein n=1 Tax=Reticulibacter mediterranei TaxID=2778369 RepID=A0A8J3N8E4_9CHLR|nr:hypothetical protein [Reticulibacter mediterranei]GHO99608.1 hypothetical protein KSF_096560 [Reticulibacter mediterranei]
MKDDDQDEVDEISGIIDNGPDFDEFAEAGLIPTTDGELPAINPDTEDDLPATTP